MLGGASIALSAIAAIAAGAAGEPPEARTGWQLTLTVHEAAPVGTLGNGVEMGDAAGPQLEWETSLLWKLSPAWSAGLYLTFGSGPSGDAAEPACAHPGPGCEASGVARYGLVVRRELAPGARWNPWLSLGAGLEALTFRATWVGEPEVTIWNGFELLRLGVGVDHRTSRYLGVGLELVGSVGEYTDVEVHWGRGVDGPLDVYGRTPEPRGLHGWIGVGVRAVLFP